MNTGADDNNKDTGSGGIGADAVGTLRALVQNASKSKFQKITRRFARDVMFYESVGPECVRALFDRVDEELSDKPVYLSFMDCAFLPGSVSVFAQRCGGLCGLLLERCIGLDQQKIVQIVQRAQGLKELKVRVQKENRDELWFEPLLRSCNANMEEMCLSVVSWVDGPGNGMMHRFKSLKRFILDLNYVEGSSARSEFSYQKLQWLASLVEESPLEELKLTGKLHVESAEDISVPGCLPIVTQLVERLQKTLRKLYLDMTNLFLHDSEVQAFSHVIEQLKLDELHLCVSKASVGSIKLLLSHGATISEELGLCLGCEVHALELVEDIAQLIPKMSLNSFVFVVNWDFQHSPTEAAQKETVIIDSLEKNGTLVGFHVFGCWSSQPFSTGETNPRIKEICNRNHHFNEARKKLKALAKQASPSLWGSAIHRLGFPGLGPPLTDKDSKATTIGATFMAVQHYFQSGNSTLAVHSLKQPDPSNSSRESSILTS